LISNWAWYGSWRMHDWGICSLTRELQMFGWQLWVIAATSHLHWNCLGFSRVQDITSGGLSASSMLVSSSTGRCDTVWLSLLPNGSYWETLGCHCTIYLSTSSSLSVFLQCVIPLKPEHLRNHQYCQRRQRSRASCQLGLGWWVAEPQSPLVTAIFWQAYLGRNPCRVFSMSLMNGRQENDHRWL